MVKRIFVILWVAVMYPVDVTTQTQLVFSVIDSNNGLSDNRVRNIMQLSDGRMMIITEGVTNIYDGTHFTQLHSNKGCIYPLSGYYGFHHTYSDKNYVWIKNYGQLSLYDKRTGNYVDNPANVFRSMGIEEGVANVYMDKSSNCWINTESDQLLYFDAEKSKLRIFCENVSFPQGQKDELLDLAVLNKHLYLFYTTGLLKCYSLLNGRLIYKVNTLNDTERNYYSRTLSIVQHGNFFYMLRNNYNGLMQAFNTSTRELTTVLKTDYWLNTIAVDKEHNLWVSCREGLWKIDKQLRDKQLISTFNLVDGADVTTEVSTLYNDTQGGFWAGTFNHGILYYHPDRFKFKNHGQYSFGKTPKDFQVQSFVRYLPDQYLVGTSKGMYGYDFKRNVLTAAPPLLQSFNCFKIMETTGGYILQTSGGYYFVNSNFTRSQLLLPNNALVTAMYTRESFLYCNTLSDLQLYNLNDHSSTLLNTRPEKTATRIWPQKILMLDQNTIVGIDSKSFFSYSLYSGRIRFPLEELENSLQQTYTDIFRDSRGLLWLGTKDGLVMFDMKNQTHRVLHTDDGLVNNSIKAITADSENRLWVTTSGGISTITVQPDESDYTIHFASFNRFDGVITNEFTEKSVYVSPSQVLLCGGVNGMNVFDLKNPWSLTSLQQPLFTSLYLNGQRVMEGSTYNGKVILDEVISVKDTVILKYNQNFVGLGFSALNYVNPTQTYYRYKLSGVDEDWSEISSGNGTGTAYYTNLAPGTYQFAVYSANNSKIWSEKPALMTIIIRPPFWKTTLAYFIYFLLAGFLFYQLMRYFSRRAKALLMQQNEEKLNQLKFRFFTNVSHEFRTPLTLVITPLESVLNEVKGQAIEAKLQSVYKNAQQLLHLVNQLLDFRRLESGGEKLKLNFGNLTDFLKQFDAGFGKMAAERRIDFRVLLPEADLWVYFDSDKLLKMVNNLLSNAFKFTPDGGSVVLQLTVKTTTFEISVADNGKGIPPKDIPFVFDRFYQTDDTRQGSGIGLHLVNEYVKLHQGEINVKSSVSAGTVFTMSLPKLSDESPVGEVPAEQNPALESTLHRKHKDYKILVVEDNDELRHFIVSEFSDSYSVVEAANGKAGLERALSEMPDLIISDVLMPEMDGIEMCRRIKTDIKLSHIPVLILTARAADELRMEGYRAGADEYIAKPFNLRLLKLRVQGLIESRLKRQRLFSEKLEVNPGDITITSIDQQLITKVLELIEKNMSNGDYSVQQLSSELYMDRTVLNKKIQSITGLTPLEFIRSIRLKRAAQLLEKGKLPVSEVAEMTGFNTQKYFTKYFREAFGVNPSQYPANHNGESK